MATLKDIAKLAGVSYGTVSNVINKKGNVSLEKIKLVEDAAKKLGYYKNISASDLRKNTKDDVSLIIPSIEEYDNNQIYSLLNIRLQAFNKKVTLYVTNYNPLLEETSFNQAVSHSEYIVIIASSEISFDFYNKADLKNTKLIFINSPFILDRDDVFNIDYNYSKIISDIQNYISNTKINKALFLADKYLAPKISSNELYKIHTFSYPYNLMTSIEILSENYNNELLILSSDEKLESVLRAKKYLLKQNDFKAIVLSSKSNVYDDPRIISYQKNINEIIETIFNIISGLSDKTNYIIDPIGFNISTTFSKSLSPLNILMIESPSTSALIKITPYLESLLNHKINIDVIRYNDYDFLEDEDYIKKYDLVRIDMANLPYLASKIYKPLNSKFESFFSKFIDNLDEYMYVDNVHYTLPFDISCMLLMFREDILSNHFIKRQYYEETREELTTPENYKTYNKIEEFINKYYKEVFNPSTLCFGGNITTGNEFLLRTKNSSNTLNDNNELNLENELVVNGLKSYEKSLHFSKNTSHRFWDDVVDDFAKGNTVMSIVYSNYINILRKNNPETFFKTKFTYPPNQISIIGGGIIGLTKHTKKDLECYNFLQLLYSDEISLLLTQLGATMPTKSI